MRIVKLEIKNWTSLKTSFTTVKRTNRWNGLKYLNISQTSIGITRSKNRDKPMGKASTSTETNERRQKRATSWAKHRTRRSSKPTSQQKNRNMRKELRKQMKQPERVDDYSKNQRKFWKAGDNRKLPESGRNSKTRGHYVQVSTDSHRVQLHRDAVFSVKSAGVGPSSRLRRYLSQASLECFLARFCLFFTFSLIFVPCFLHFTTSFVVLCCVRVLVARFMCIRSFLFVLWVVPVLLSFVA